MLLVEEVLVTMLLVEEVLVAMLLVKEVLVGVVRVVVVLVVVVVVGLIAVEVTGFAGPGASLDMWTTAAALMSPVPEIIAFLRIVNEHLNGHDTFRAYLTSRLDCGRFFVLFLLLLDRSKSPRLEFGVSYSSCRGVLSQARIIFDQLIGIQGQQGRPLTFNNRTSKGLL